MAKTSLLYLIYNDLTEALKGKGYPIYFGRPTNLPEKTTAFLVIELPVELLGRVAGDMKVMADTFGLISMYVKAKSNGTMNIEAQGDGTEIVTDVFPINTDNITASKPRILVSGNDGDGYHVTKITFKLRTKFNITN